MNDLKFAFRQLRQHPLTNGVIILTIALLIGAVSVIYASLRNEQARFVPFPEPDQMMKLWRIGDKRIEELFPADLFHEYADRLRSFEGLGALGWRQQMTLTEVGEPVSYHVMGASASLLPLTTMGFGLLGWGFHDQVTIAAGAGAEEKTTQTSFSYGSDEFANLSGMRLLRGRGLSADAALASSEVLVNEQFVRQNLGNSDPLGRQITVAHGQSSDKHWYTIVGVVRNRPPLTTYEEGQPELVLGFREAQMNSGLVFLAQTKAGAKTVAPSIREMIQRLDASQPVNQPVFVSDLLEQRAAGQRSGMIFLAALAGVGLFIALMGVYGVVAFTVVERTHEVGIRLALGASRRDILRLMLWQGARLLLFGVWPGLLIGSMIMVGAVRQSLIAGLSPFAPPTYAVVILVVGAAGLFASFWPAKKASELNPMEALRRE